MDPFFVIFICALSLPYCRVCFLQPCGHLLGKGWPLGSCVCDVFLCFCRFPVRCPVLRCRIDGTTESVMVAYTHKYAKV